ncbi:41K blood stage antigen precursor 41-3, putative [Plasmodium malariae]|uniref:41K blood stage antigen 41-3, putative n=1 Tax=Plasmodium malariae TaxID=5858 RepID=A0A1D3TCJ9_PLAMA|nr:41K blood stage antigen precursor 41-3, putative [Plasmodium malariae]SCP02529.1 41K blood stage antigen precursor 41-3, putative [Plasmodium malariae]
MLFRLNFFLCCVVLASCALTIILSDEENTGWSTDYEYNSKSLPSIEVKLSPPENPLPQVSAEIKLLESARLKLEEGMMQKLEDEYNKSLSSSKIKIQDTVEKLLSIFNDPNILGSVISNSVKTLKKENLRKVKDSEEGEKELKNYQKNNQAKSGPLPPPELRNHTSFLQQNYLSEISEPSVDIKEKIEEIEQYRTDEEVTMFETAISELGILTDITILELQKQIQLQLNPFLVDKKVLHRTLKKELKELGQREEKQKIKENFQRQSSFLEEGEYEDTGNILNVKISQTDYGYPTIDELVMQMQRRRDITEKLERQKILDLQMKLLKVQSEIIKDALHFSISKVIAQYSPIVETMKIESMKMIY